MSNEYGIRINLQGNASEKIGSINKSLGGMKSILSELKGAIGATFAAFELISFIKESEKSFKEYEQAVAHTVGVLNSTKQAAGFAFKDIVAFSKEMSEQSIWDEKQQMEMQSMLMTFTNIKGSIYRDALPAINDFATRFKMDLPSAANLVGKALNNPLTGMMKLSRQGVVFSDSQKKQIEYFSKTNQIAKAQAIILKELNTEFGGLAKLETLTDSGKLAMAAKTWDSLREKVGQLITQIKVALIPLFEKAVKFIEILFSALKKIWPVLSQVIVGFMIWKGISFITTLIDNVNILVKSFKGLQAVLTAVANVMNGIQMKMFLITAGAILITSLWQRLDPSSASSVEYKKLLDERERLSKMNDDESRKRLKEIQKEIEAYESEGIKGILKRAGTGIGSMFNSLYEAVKLPELNPEDLANKLNKSVSAITGEGGIDIPAGGGAYNTSNLSGASGGLGSAKNITITIDNVMQINTEKIDTPSITQLAGQAAEEFLRQINNYAYGAGVM